MQDRLAFEGRILEIRNSLGVQVRFWNAFCLVSYMFLIVTLTQFGIELAIHGRSLKVTVRSHWPLAASAVNILLLILFGGVSRAAADKIVHARLQRYLNFYKIGMDKDWKLHYHATPDSCSSAMCGESGCSSDRPDSQQGT